MEAAGDIATGALMGCAVEPATGAHDAHAPTLGALCLNCGTTLIGEYCHACGQNGHVHRTISSIGHDLLHGVFHFEGKIWRTLPMLVVHPGALTRRYVAGERARFVSPLALFLFVVFLTFATIHAIAGELEIPDMPPAERQHTLANIERETAKVTAKLAQVEAQKNRPAAEKAKDVSALRTSLNVLNATHATIAGGGSPVGTGFTTVVTGWHALDKGIAKANANPSLAIYKLQASAYKYSWALIPISVPFVALLFLWKRRFKMYDHAIFVTYSLAFMMLLVMVLTIAGAIGVWTGLIVWTALLAPPIHMFVQLRGAYSLRKLSALWRTVALTNFAFLALTAFVTLLLAMGLME